MAGVTALLGALNAAIDESFGLRLATAIAGGVSAALVGLTGALRPTQRLVRAQRLADGYAGLREAADLILATWDRYDDKEAQEKAEALATKIEALRARGIELLDAPRDAEPG
jgi:hypothetical protein